MSDKPTPTFDPPPVPPSNARMHEGWASEQAIVRDVQAVESTVVAIVRHVSWPLAAVLIVIALAIAVLLWPAKHPVAPVGIAATPAPVPGYARTANDVQTALAAIAAMRGGTPAYAQPAVSVVEKALPGTGLTGAQIAQLLGALRPPVQTVAHVQTTVQAPSPKPVYTVPPEMANVSPLTSEGAYELSRRATVDALGDTSITTHVDLTQEERAPSRIGSIVSSSGAGLSWAVVRRGHWDLDLAAVLAPNGSYGIKPVVGVIYRIPHTSLGIGPTIGGNGNSGVRPGIGAVITF
jgi:hypothetical protein